MKSITGRLIGGAFILALVTVASLGIRHVRFSIHRARVAAGPVISEAGRDHGAAKTRMIAARPKLQPGVTAETQKNATSDNYTKTPSEPDKSRNAAAMAKSSEGNHAKTKAEGSKGGLEKIPLGDNENLYITKEGQLVYVGKGPDGKITKFRVEIDATTGEVAAVEGAGKAGGLQKISIGGNDNIYITDEGQTWYVTEGSKSRVEIDDSTGEITVLEQYGTEDGK